jgi:hypothetical protein
MTMRSSFNRIWLVLTFGYVVMLSVFAVIAMVMIILGRGGEEPSSWLAAIYNWGSVIWLTSCAIMLGFHWRDAVDVMKDLWREMGHG